MYGRCLCVCYVVCLHQEPQSNTDFILHIIFRIEQLLLLLLMLVVLHTCILTSNKIWLLILSGFYFFSSSSSLIVSFSFCFYCCWWCFIYCIDTNWNRMTKEPLVAMTRTWNISTTTTENWVRAHMNNEQKDCVHCVYVYIHVCDISGFCCAPCALNSFPLNFSQFMHIHTEQETLFFLFA